MNIEFPSSYNTPDFQDKMRLELVKLHSPAQQLRGLSQSDIGGAPLPETLIKLDDPKTEIARYKASAYQISVLTTALFYEQTQNIPRANVLRQLGYFGFMTQRDIGGPLFDTDAMEVIKHGKVGYELSAYVEGMLTRQVIIPTMELPFILAGFTPNQVDCNFFWGKNGQIFETRDSLAAKTMIIPVNTDAFYVADIAERDKQAAIIMETKTGKAPTTYFRFLGTTAAGNNFTEVRTPAVRANMRRIDLSNPDKKGLEEIIVVDASTRGIVSATRRVITKSGQQSLSVDNYQSPVSGLNMDADELRQQLSSSDLLQSRSALTVTPEGVVSTYEGRSTDNKQVRLSGLGQGSPVITYAGNIISAGALRVREDGRVVAKLMDGSKLEVTIGAGGIIEEVKVYKK